MSPERQWSFLIRDMIEAIEKIEQFTSGMTFEAFSRDVRTVDAVLRNFQVIGEASRRLRPDIRDANLEIEWKQIIAMRHVVVHDYEGVRLPIVWETMTVDLPPLKDKLLRILAKAT